MVIRAISLADIATGDKLALHPEVCSPGPWKVSSCIPTWPTSKAMNSDWTTWASYLHKGLDDRLNLCVTLGKWTGFHYSTDIW
eukprot:4735393-Ditylum_brightwellii.AAC.1